MNNKLDKLIILLEKISNKKVKLIIKESEIFKPLRILERLRDLKEKALDRQNKLIPIPVFPYGDTITKLPTTLSELFAIEQQKIESKES